MYYRRWTRMFVRPAFKYLSKYGVLKNELAQYAPLLAQTDPVSEILSPKSSLRNLRRQHQKDIDNSLIKNLFAKYPDLKYQKIDSTHYPGQKLTGFSYAYAFIAEQKKLMEEGYSQEKAFEICQNIYRESAARKLDQSLMARGLAISNRARSLMSVYQQEIQKEGRDKVARTQREVTKYKQKLQAIQKAANKNPLEQANDSIEDYQKLFIKITDTIEQAAQTVPKDQDPKKMKGFIHPQTGLQIKPAQYQAYVAQKTYEKCSTLFNMFYERAAARDKLDGLTDTELFKQLSQRPSQIKRQARQVLKFLEKHDYATLTLNGQLVIRSNAPKNVRKLLENSPQVKEALLISSLNADRVVDPKIRFDSKLIRESKRLSNLNVELMLSLQDARELANKKVADLEIATADRIPRRGYRNRTLQTTQERLLRLQMRYLSTMISDMFREKERQDALEGIQPAEKKQPPRENRQLTDMKLQETISRFRRLKFRLERRHLNEAASDLLFPEHEAIREEINVEGNVEFEELHNYLEMSNDDRRLTTKNKSNDDKVNILLQERFIPEKPQRNEDKVPE